MKMNRLELIKQKIKNLKKVSGMQLRTMVIPDKEWIVDSLVPNNCVTFIAGKAGCSKTFLGLEIVIKCLQGEPVLGIHSTRKLSKILYCDEENPLKEIQNRWIPMTNDMKNKKLLENVEFYSYNNLKLSSKDFPVIDGLAELEKPDLIIIDSAVGFYDGKENDAGDASKFTDFLKLLMTKHNCTIIVLHHVTKGSEANMDSLRGSGQFAAFARSILHITKYGHGRTAKYTMKQVKSSYREECEILTYQIMNTSDDVIELKICPKKKGDYIFETIAEDIRNWLVNNKIKTFKAGDVKTEFKDKNYKPASITNAINLLKSEGIVTGEKVYSCTGFCEDDE